MCPEKTCLGSCKPDRAGHPISTVAPECRGAMSWSKLLQGLVILGLADGWIGIGVCIGSNH